jgi:hypothetical protein
MVIAAPKLDASINSSGVFCQMVEKSEGTTDQSLSEPLTSDNSSNPGDCIGERASSQEQFCRCEPVEASQVRPFPNFPPRRKYGTTGIIVANLNFLSGDSTAR